MKDSDYHNLVELTPSRGVGFLPANQRAEELLNTSFRGEVIAFKEVSRRDISFHRGYFSLLNYIYSWLPDSFKMKIPEKHFYQFLKHIQGAYNVVYRFKDGTTFVEYKSISFGRMSQQDFEDYVREQLTVIYADVIGELFTESEAKMVIDAIEDEYQKYLIRL